MPADKDDKQEQHQVNSPKKLAKPKLSLGAHLAMLQLNLARNEKLLDKLEEKLRSTKPDQPVAKLPDEIKPDC